MSENSINSALHPIFKELLPLMPLFLQKRRAGLSAPQQLMKELALDGDRDAFFTLMQLQAAQGSYGGEPVTPPQIKSRARYLYSTIDHLARPLALLKERRLVIEDHQGRISLSPHAQDAMEQLQIAARAHVAQLQPLPSNDLHKLADQLERAVNAILADPVLSPRPGSHLAASRSLATFGPDVPPMVRIEQDIYDLWMARDDAHIKAWRDAGLEGPPMQVLTLIWSGEVSTVPVLTEMLHADQTPQDLESSLAYLLDNDYLIREHDTLQLTPQGVLIREDIERDTDLLYFAPWPYTPHEAEWLRDNLRELVNNLPAPPPPPAQGS